jgi:hypothetical protein
VAAEAVVVVDLLYQQLQIPKAVLAAEAEPLPKVHLQHLIYPHRLQLLWVPVVVVARAELAPVLWEL